MKCVLCILEGLQNVEVTSAETLKTALDHSVDGAKTAITVTRGNALCHGHFSRESLGFVIE